MMGYSMLLLSLFFSIFSLSLSPLCVCPQINFSVDEILEFQGIQNATSKEKNLAKMISALDHKLKVAVGEIEKEKERTRTCQGIVRNAVCGRKIRFFMDTFGIEAGVQKRDINTRSKYMQAALEKIRHSVADRRLQLSNHVYNLRQLYNEYLSDSVEVLVGSKTLSWRERVKEEFLELRKVHINQRTSGNWTENSKTPKLNDLVADFYSAKDENQAVNVFETQCFQDFWSRKTIGIDEKNEIDKLVVQWSDNEKKGFIPKRKPPYYKGKGVTSQEYEFIAGILETGNYFIVENRPLGYCLEVFYFGEYRFIQYIISRMERRWGSKDFQTLVDRFCCTFHTLYNRISVADINFLCELPILLNCIPNSTDYQHYVKSIVPSPKYEQDYLLIVETLGLIDSPPKE